MKNRTLITHGAVLLTVVGSISVASGGEAHKRQLAMRYAEYESEIYASAKRGDLDDFTMNELHEIENNLKTKYFGFPLTEDKYEEAHDAYLDLMREKNSKREREREIQ